MVKSVKSTSRERTEKFDKAIKFSRGDLVLIPLTCLTLFCWYWVLANFGALTQYFIRPENLMYLMYSHWAIFFVVAVLGTVYVYKRLIAQIRIPVYPCLVAYLFSFLATWLGFVSLAAYAAKINDAAKNCTGFFGVASRCADNDLLFVSILLLNPFSLAAWGLLSVSGVVVLLLKRRTKNRNKAP